MRQINDIEKAKLILRGKKRHDEADSPEFRKRRERFVQKLTNLKADGRVEVSTMYCFGDEVVSGRNQIYNFLNRYWNTLKYPESFIVGEIEGKDLNVIWKAVVETSYNLMKDDKHFAILHAKGSKSYYILLCDFLELNDYNPIQRAKIRELFWRHYVPFQYFHLIDRGLFYEHKMPLVYSPHWKYGNIFDVIFEFVPSIAGEVEVLKPKPVRRTRIVKKTQVYEYCEKHPGMRIPLYSSDKKMICPECLIKLTGGYDATAISR